MKITKRRRKRYGGSLGGDIFIFVVLALLGLFMIFPIYLSVIQSLTPVEELFLFPPRLYVQNITDQNFADLLATASNMWVPFSRYTVSYTHLLQGKRSLRTFLRIETAYGNDFKSGEYLQEL